MTGDPRIDGYDWAGGREAMLCFGPDTGPVVVAVLPLFEEANRTRAFVVAILRALAVHGIGSALPDVPGQGESMALLETISLPAMQAGFVAAVARAGAHGRPCYTIGIRSGVLVDKGIAPTGASARSDDAAARRRWHLSPQDGSSLLRELSRMKKPDSGAAGPGDAATPIVIAGNLLSPVLLADLATSTPGHAARTVRLATDPAPADRHIDGAPLWRRSEPATDDALSQVLAADIADWIAACEA